MRAFTVLVTTAALLGATATVSAQQLTVSWPTPVNISTTDYWGNDPDLTVSSDGQRQTAVWVTEGSSSRTLTASSADGGQTWTHPWTLADSTEQIYDARAAGSADGQHLFAAWNQNGDRSPLRRIYVSRSSNSGSTWTERITVSGFSASAPHVVSSTDGSTAVVVWSEQALTSSVYAARWTAQTDTWTAPVLVSPAGENATVVAVSASGDAQVVTALWRDGTNRVRAATSADAGTTWSAPRDLSTSGLTAQLPTARTSTDGSRIVAAWVEGNGVAVPNHVATSVSVDKGQTWSAPNALPEWQANWGPELTASPDAMKVAMVWPALDAQNTVARTVTSSDGGVTWSSAVDASPAGTTVSAPLIAGSSDGQRLSVLWYEAPPSQTLLRATFSGDAGKTWSTPATLTTSSGFDDPQLVVAAAADGSPTAVWRQYLSPSMIRTATADLVSPARAQTLKKKPPKKLKKGKKATLAKKTKQGAKVTWKSSTKKRCTVKKYKVTAKKKGTCKLSAKAPAVTGFQRLSKHYKIKVK